MKQKTKKPVRVEIIKPAERRALRQTGRTAKVRTLAREVDAAYIRFESLRESELQIKAKADAAWTHANALVQRLVKAVEAEDLAAAKHARTGTPERSGHHARG